MRKKNRGFFLAETIVMIALVASVVAFVYPNISKLYQNFNNKLIYYDQTEDLYILKAYSEVLQIDSLTNNGCMIFKDGKITNEQSATEIKLDDNNKIGNIDHLYLTGYMTNLSDDNYNKNKYLKRLKKTTNDTPSYRLIGIFDYGDIKKYASIKVENPDENRSCNLGG